mgnify:CR=1 FL=1
MRTGVFGGSFDPIHYGHLLLAETARDQMNLDRVVFVPLGVPPHFKTNHTTCEDRYQMVSLAIEQYSGFLASRYEIDSSGTSYTFKTLNHFRESYPNDELFLIVSSETFNDLPNWRRPELICELTSLIIAQRADFPSPKFDLFQGIASLEKIESYKKQTITMPHISLSSTLIRERVKAGESIRFLLPDSVIQYIVDKGLYSNQ